VIIEIVAVCYNNVTPSGLLLTFAIVIFSTKSRNWLRICSLTPCFGARINRRKPQ